MKCHEIVISPVASVEISLNRPGDISGEQHGQRAFDACGQRERVPSEEVSQDSQLSRVLPNAVLPLAVLVI
jgi:hypothetical protein